MSSRHIPFVLVSSLSNSICLKLAGWHPRFFLKTLRMGDFGAGTLVHGPIFEEPDNNIEYEGANTKHNPCLIQTGNEKAENPVTFYSAICNLVNPQ